ncbi:MAG TPA: class I SAM-dependent methyltransferase [Methanomassiliicoccales archaeon]|nr:class I SAM-dependent methyltransferase [Methanomassiliicoccales archaeon]
MDESERINRIYDPEKAHEYRTVLDAAYYNTYHGRVMTHLLKEICRSFAKERLDVLELGCGTGRYFSCLDNVGSITGVDISRSMIEQAHRRVEEEHYPADVCLECGDINTWRIPQEKFDLIYSIGTLGEYCRLSPPIVNKVMSGLKEGGCFLFTVFDANHDLSSRARSLAVRGPMQRITARTYHQMPEGLKRPFGRTFFSYFLSRSELLRMLGPMAHHHPSVVRLSCDDESWTGTHLIVMMHRPPAPYESRKTILETAVTIR